MSSRFKLSRTNVAIMALTLLVVLLLGIAAAWRRHHGYRQNHPIILTDTAATGTSSINAATHSAPADSAKRKSRRSKKPVEKKSSRPQERPYLDQPVN